MSNQEEIDLLDSISEPDNAPDALIIPKGDNEPVRESVAPAFSGPKKAVKTVVTNQVVQTSVDAHAEEQSNLTRRVADAEKVLQGLLKGNRAGVNLGAEPAIKPKIDWKRVTEKDVFDLNIPLEAYNNDMPDYSQVKLKDSTKVPRWVNVNNRRLGPMKGMGYVFVKPEDIDGELMLGVQANEVGQLRFDDVVLMMIDKQLYYGMLRANHMRATNMVDPKKAHQVAKERVQSDLAGAQAETGVGDTTRSGDFTKYNSASKMNIYAPGFDL